MDDRLLLHGVDICQPTRLDLLRRLLYPPPSRTRRCLRWAAKWLRKAFPKRGTEFAWREA